MDYLYSIILGIVQGLTEFWPISSSGHLIIAHELLNFNFVDNLSFDVALHLGTLAALLVFFSKDLARYIVSFFRSFANWNLANDFNQRMAWYIVVGSIPAGVAGFFLESKADTVFRNLWLVAVLFVAVGLLFFVFEKYSKKIKNLEELSWRGAIIIGLMQVLSLLPGVSRSGITILGGLSQGLKREQAARFSFLLSVPVIFGAGLKKMYDGLQAGFTGGEWLIILVGFLTSAGVGYLAIRVLLSFLQRRPLNAFAYYRIILGLAVIIFLIFK
ncbi:MAG: undecaprenyl-diphosphatase UppP [Patescibacteria group bacterium]|jgi:undecaprenyl-diphosphatase